ncbi:MAG: aspartate-semialdehyde dehydrogenase [Candidatus Wallbacteria bacterium]|nr:aspartate-semialdehyde dehydrogenase [Candidatus Wallbacteria bacterium]
MSLTIGIFGVTGAVGQELLSVIERKSFPVRNLRVFASTRSAGKKIDTYLGKVIVEDAGTADFTGLDLAFFAIGGGWPRENAPKATAAGCYVIDNSSTFRYDKNVPLIIPQVNPEAIGKSKLIANPNCTTAIAIIPIYHVYKKFGIRKAIFSTYQAASGAGTEGITELLSTTREYLDGNPGRHEVFPHPLAFNLIPQIDVFQKNGYTKEEMKVVWETRKILGNENLAISCTAVRIPTVRAHSEAITLETDKKITPTAVKKLFSDVDGLDLVDDPASQRYPMPIQSAGKYNVEVGRIRQSLVFGMHGIDFFVSGDQLLRGAALNAVEIGEILIRKGVFKK